MKLLMIAGAAAALLAGAAPPALGQEHEHKHDAHKAAAPREQMAWGVAGEPKAATRTIQVAMTDDMRFTPDRIEVRQGETVKLVVKNSGKMLHELVLGTKQELDAHAAAMAKHPGMEHDEAHMVHVKPAKSRPLVWNFNRAGEFQFACLIPGHYQAGMFGTVVVQPSSKQGNKS
jgi:uncharacterized cupredoxin-like copper-binding protein